MARLFGIEIPHNKRVVAGLTYIYGIGWTSSKKICEVLKIEGAIRIKDLDEAMLAKIRDYVYQNYVVVGDLKKQVRENVKRLTTIRCYRGRRLGASLPSRGQRTRSNAKTSRGKAGSSFGKNKK